MISEIRLRNFKAFDEQTVELRPITILLGPNNAGKSSLLAPLRLLSQTLQSYDGRPPLLLKGLFGDFGTYRDIVYGNHRGRPIKLGLTIKPTGNGPDSPRRPRALTSISLDIELKYRAKRRELVLVALELSSNDERLLQTKLARDSNRQLIETVGRHHVPQELRSTFTASSLQIHNFIPRLRFGAVGRERDSSTAGWLAKAKLEQTFEKARLASFDLIQELTSIEYLGPLRAAPQRTYAFSGERRQHVGSAGEFASEIFMADSISPRHKTDPRTRTNDWLRLAGLAREIAVVPISDRYYEIRVTNFDTGEDQNIADVGYGHSQILPVLVAGYSLPSGSCFIVEQPEIHLHPRGQSHLARFIADLHQSGVQTLVETHSDYLVVGIQELIAARSLQPSDVALYYLYPKGEEKEITRIELDENARFLTEWPQGFFPERLDQARKLSSTRAQ